MLCPPWGGFICAGDGGSVCDADCVLLCGPVRVCSGAVLVPPLCSCPVRSVLECFACEPDWLQPANTRPATRQIIVSILNSIAQAIVRGSGVSLQPQRRSAAPGLSPRDSGRESSAAPTGMMWTWKPGDAPREAGVEAPPAPPSLRTAFKAKMFSTSNALNLYAVVLDIVVGLPWEMRVVALKPAGEVGSVQDLVYGFPRTLLPRTRVNRPQDG